VTVSLQGTSDGCVQYRESGLDFVTRLAARIGYEVVVDDTAAAGGTRDRSTPILWSTSAYRPSRVTTLPRIYGVQTGIVTGSSDPAPGGSGAGTVKVRFPWLDAAACGSDASCWARVASSPAGGDRGFYALPEVDDEVLVAFEHGDIRFPYILGSISSREINPGPVQGPPCPRPVVSGGGRWVLWSSPANEIVIDDCQGTDDIFRRGPLR
jgi:uncharacterized protein involved in type VI secretion and phage assembly